MDKKISFRDLNGWLKTAVIVSYLTLILYGYSFITGFITGFNSV